MYVDQLNRELNIPRSLSDLGVADPDIDQILHSALKDPNCGGNPIELTEQNLRPLIENLLSQ